jgi:hypothetical protein
MTPCDGCRIGALIGHRSCPDTSIPGLTPNFSFPHKPLPNFHRRSIHAPSQRVYSPPHPIRLRRTSMTSDGGSDRQARGDVVPVGSAAAGRRRCRASIARPEILPPARRTGLDKITQGACASRGLRPPCNRRLTPMDVCARPKFGSPFYGLAACLTVGLQPSSFQPRGTYIRAGKRHGPTQGRPA